MLRSSSTTKSPTPPLVMSQQPKFPSKGNTIFINFFAGGVAGTAGVFVTCPLDVVQTRLQSSYVVLKSAGKFQSTSSSGAASVINLGSSRFGSNVFCYMRHILRTEGLTGLYKGLVPNLIGIAPSRAIYFAIYTKSKSFFSSTRLSNSSLTHMLSALTASWSVSSVTNPIWFLKTRLQLDLTPTGERKTISEVVKDVYRNEGIRGFYRGLSASYIGASETMIYFVIYERLKLILGDQSLEGKLSAVDYICAAFLSKFIATVSVYPHEVARTRMRQESSNTGNNLYRGFIQTLVKVYREERFYGLYGGMAAHLMRQVPNTVIMFVTYETIVNFFTSP